MRYQRISKVIDIPKCDTHKICIKPVKKIGSIYIKTNSSAQSST